MTVTLDDTDAATRTAAPGDVPAGLGGLIGDVDSFFRDHWARQPVLLRAASDTASLISEEEIWEEVDCGLLARPYFTVFNEGVRSAISDMSRKRRVVGSDQAGYINPVQIRADFAAGGTFKLNQAEHWHPRIRALVQGMQPHFSGGLEAFVFLSPPGKTAMQAHTDGAHVFIIQVSGVKDWVVGSLDETAHSDSTIHEGEILPHLRTELTLRPGDVMYMPHGCPHYATARVGNSIHIAITVEEPTAENLVDVVLAGFMHTPGYGTLDRTHHLTPLAQRTEQLRRELLDYLARVNDEAVLAKAVTLRREHRC